MKEDSGVIHITKRNGDRVPFDVQKLIDSLDRSGTSEEDIQHVIHEVARNMVEGMSTRKVYQLAYAILRRKSKHAAGKYRLKKAIFELGPTGYPFERFVGELLKNQGYRVEVGQIVQGYCVQHEVDVIAEKNDRRNIIECKFHHDLATKSDVKVSLYFHSRFLDIKKQWESLPDNHKAVHQGWLVTNTRFTEDALQYGECAGLQMISWDYPDRGSLRERIDISGLHPITALQSLTKKEKQHLLEQDIVLCKNISPSSLEKAGINRAKFTGILKEAESLVNKR